MRLFKFIIFDVCLSTIERSFFSMNTCSHIILSPKLALVYFFQYFTSSIFIVIAHSYKKYSPYSLVHN